jgi:cell division protein FtsB
LRALLQALYAVVLIALASGALKGWRDHQRATAREATLAAEIAATEARIALLQRRIDRLQNDPATLDRVAREELGLVRPEEVVIVLPEAPAARADRP